MALPDIKDAGAILEVLRFGWPWHGVIAGSEVAATGQPYAQPAVNESWLVDMGLAEIDLTPEQIASEAAAGRSWLNYALLPRGSVYNTSIGDASFIHVDAVGNRWRIDLAFSFPALQTLRITADITEFGVLVVNDGAATAATVQKTVDVVCTEIETTNSVPTGVTYTSRSARIEDVYTNGSKALIGVHLNDGTVADLFSIVTLEISGNGGVDGSGLELSAAESLAQTALTLGVDNSEYSVEDPEYYRGVLVTDDYDAVCPPTYSGTYTATYSLGSLYDPGAIDSVTSSATIFARYAYFSDVGVPIAVRLRYGNVFRTQHVLTTDWELDFLTAEWECSLSGGGPAPLSRRYGKRYISQTSGWWLLENDTVVDILGWQTVIDSDLEVNWMSGRSPGFLNVYTNSVTTTTKLGSLADHLPAGEFTISGSEDIAVAFRNKAQSAYADAGAINTMAIGLHRMNSKATAFMAEPLSGPVYGLATTPVGPITPGITPSSSVNFTWNKKTGEYTFAANPICYV